MKKEILITLLCAGLILITPFTVVAQENRITPNIVEEPDDIEGLVTQIRVVINEILQKYGHIPMVRGLCDMILNILNSFSLLLFCIFLVIITIPVFLIVWFFWSTYGVILPTLGPLLLLLVVIFGDECPPSKSLNNLFPSLNPIITLSETNDITNLAKDCPCLQE